MHLNEKKKNNNKCVITVTLKNRYILIWESGHLFGWLVHLKLNFKQHMGKPQRNVVYCNIILMEKSHEGSIL